MAAASIQYCKVKGCRFSNFHTTVAHRCGACNQHGHGQIECNDDNAKSFLIRYLEDSMPNERQCEYMNCPCPWSHASQSHHCFICGLRSSHSAQQCPVNHRDRSRAINELSGAATKEPELIVNVIEDAIINKCCPMCRQCSDIDLEMTIFTDSPCPICLDTKPKIIFSGCKHANVCRDCAVLL